MTLNIYELGHYYRHLRDLGLVVSCIAGPAALQKKIGYISFDSNDVRENTLFICKGVHFSPEYLCSALRNGAVAYISEKEYELPADICDTPRLIVSDIRAVMAEVASVFYNDVWQKLHMIGITGTKGKSSTAFFVKYIIDEYMRSSGGRESAIVSGVTNYDGVSNEESHLTTPESFQLYRHIYNAVSSGISYLTMEISSQGLKYDRVRGITYDIGCFLNIGNDHISSIEHSCIDDYLESKLKLFSQSRTICINRGSDRLDRIMEVARSVQQSRCESGGYIPEIVTFGTDPGSDYLASDIRSLASDGGCISFHVRSSAFDDVFEISMHGLFNVDNALAAITMTHCLGIPLDSIKAGLKKARVSGRMEMFTSRKRGFSVIVDYAHNQMSFETLFRSVKKEFPGRKISIVFGCPGGKAQQRRRELGTIAGRYADRIYLTEEDAGEESVTDICREIAGHVRSCGCPFEIIEDRGEAIRRALSSADRNTVVLITGKGRETRQKRGLAYITTPSDVDYVQELLKFEY